MDAFENTLRRTARRLGYELHHIRDSDHFFVTDDDGATLVEPMNLEDLGKWLFWEETVELHDRGHFTRH